MPVTKVGIVYQTDSGELRRWILPDSDSELVVSHPVGPDETMLIVDRGQIPADPTQALPFILAAIQRAKAALP